MKSYIVGVILYFALSMLACQDTREDLIHPENSYYKSIGKEIPVETGIRWIEFYKKTYETTNGRTSFLTTTYEISAEQLDDMLNSVDNLTGVAFHYGTDGFGKRHIIAIPIDVTLKLWTSIPGRIYVDTNTGNPISQSVAQTWAQRYKDAHPNDTWFHFFGSYIFDEIRAVPYFTWLDIEPALDDLNLTPQMLLIVWNNPIGLLGLMGRTADEECRVFDASSACPPCTIE